MSTLNIPLMDNNITQDDLGVLIEFLGTSPRLTQGDNVLRFEEEWSRWLGVKHSVFVNSGSSANLLTLSALYHLYGGGEIIVPPLTWVSDIASVLQAGFTPVFVDIDPDTLGLDENKVLSAITGRTKAVFLTHILGFNALTQTLVDELEKRGIPLVEDVCESHGAQYKGRKLGSIGFASNFSFYYAHHMSTIEGGMICCNDDKFYQTIRMLRSHGMVRESTDAELKARYQQEFPDVNPDFTFAFPAYNVRSTEINAVIGLSQLPRLDENNIVRRENFDLLLDLLDSRYYKTNFAVEGSSNYAFTIVLEKPDKELREAVEASLRQANVEFRRGLSGGGNQLRQPYLRHLNLKLDEFPVVEHIHEFAWYIGNYPSLPKQKIQGLCDLLNRTAQSLVKKAS